MSDLSQQDWATELEKVGAERGFFERVGADHSALFVRGDQTGGGTLIVTFENLDHVYENAGDRMPWGYDFVTSRGWSMLGMMAHDWTWYRDEAVFDFFDRLRDDGFFDQFDQVVFYGASMGGYAASVFCSAAPGATVILLSPQATLSRDIAPWETRYRKVWHRDFTGRYGYGPEEVEVAGPVYLFYDPREPLDAMHATLFQADNVTKLRCRFMGHRIASLWLKMGVLKKVVMGCVDDTLTPEVFYKLMRTRLHVPRYQKEMLDRLLQMDRPRLVIRYTKAVLNTRGGPAFRKAMRAAEQRIAKFEQR
ncbi:phosphoadenosine phosphosulfate reductase [Nereida sp. MMG025]|uniref:phosphoadenosine phosphosulfate reductase n=1 Tax=Nereida sp. MMG025 TaxID=2909981 RepID=UPI001F284323|nr:phosphoadenosine phosphosulfate reductase [Nereida sp. MMG025]MCF6445479.1 phosphoadenosine phosphosulfate reductase [Nereida sp. MMG025]